MFSLGSVLYATCTGQPPFRGSTALAVLRHVSDQAPTPIRAVNPDVPEWLQMFVVRLMAKEPAHRFQSAAEVAGLLEGYLAHLRQPMTVLAPNLPPSPADSEIECPPDSPPLRVIPWLAAASVALLATLGLFAWHLTGSTAWQIFAQGAAGQPQSMKEFYQDFRGKAVHPALVWSGRDGDEVIEPGDKGLRIQLPGNRTRKDPVGPALTSPVQGDVEITTGYELLQADQPKTGNGVGFELYVALDAPGRDAVGFVRVKRADGEELFVCTQMTTVDGKRRYDVKTFPATAKTGQLRLSRKGREYVLWAAEADGQFQELIRYDIEPAALKMVRVAAYPGQSTEPVDVRIYDLRVKSTSEIPIPPEDTPRTGNSTGKPAVPRGWLVALELIGLAITLSLAAVGGWIWVRRSRGEMSPEPSTSGQSPGQPEAAAIISFPCGGCGKTIRAKAKLAGMKAKCPQCGHPLLVPNVTATVAALPKEEPAQRFPGGKKVWVAGGILVLAPLVVLGWWLVGSRRSPTSTALAGPSFLNMTLGNEPVAEIEEPGFYYQEFFKDEPFRWTDGKARLVIPLRAKGTRLGDCWCRSRRSALAR